MKSDARDERPSGEGLLTALEQGTLRVAEPDGEGGWRVQAWVKEAILDVFRRSPNAVFGGSFGGGFGGETSGFVDKHALPPRRFELADGVRLVPGGSAVRRGAHVAHGVILMPPCYVNVGAFVGEGSLVDSHALIGSCAQIGARVHVSAGAQIGGVLEPVGARPVIVEDDCLVGGNSGLYEGVLVRRAAVIAAGVVLTGSTRVFDLVHARELGSGPEGPLEIPAGAVVVPGARAARGDFAREHGLSLACAVIPKYRDESTGRATSLEEALR